MSDERQLTPIQQVSSLIENLKPKFEELTKGQKQNFEQEKLFAITLLQKNEYLQTCAMNDRASFAGAILQSATLGLTLNPAMRLSYLVPRDKKVCYDISYMGIIELAHRAGMGNIICNLVHSGDEFEYYASENTLSHKLDPFASVEERGKMVGGYCIAEFHNQKYICVMSIDELFSIRDRSQSVKSGRSSPWITDLNEMLKKTIIKRAAKMWPKSEKLFQAIEIDNQNNGIDFEAEAEKIREEEHEKYLKRKEEMKAAQIKLDDLKKEVGQKVESAVNDLRTMPEKIAYLKNLGLKSIAEIASMRHIEEVEELNSKIGV